MAFMRKSCRNTKANLHKIPFGKDFLKDFTQA